jgi:hypothetical protein
LSQGGGGQGGGGSALSAIGGFEGDNNAIDNSDEDEKGIVFKNNEYESLILTSDTLKQLRGQMPKKPPVSRSRKKERMSLLPDEDG